MICRVHLPVPREESQMNSIMVIHPYKYQGVWVFDDEKADLVQEPFVGGADIILDRITAHIPAADRGVTILFSAQPFPGFQHELEWAREELMGNVYRSNDLNMEGWLCPALFKYFPTAPQRIYVEVKPKSVNS